MKDNPGPSPSAAPPSSGVVAHGSKVLFWYVRYFFTLGFAAGATATVWYQVINKHFPLAITPYGVMRRSFRYQATVWAIAALIVVGPILFAFAVVIRRSIRRGEIELNRGVRPWISYGFLLLAAAVTITDVVTVFRFLINGDYSTRFFLKSLVILVVSGWIIIYLWMSLRAPDALAGSRVPRRMGVAAAIVMLVSIIAGFTLIHSPAMARARTFDLQRSFDLERIRYAVQQYYAEHSAVPASLDVLGEGGWVEKSSLTDPGTGESYGYRVIGNEQYELCATFSTDTREEQDDAADRYQPWGRDGRLHLHAAETTCFEFNARIDIGR
jgi:hypothetical protein